MTSVRSLPRRLNGSKFLAIGMLLLAFSACGITRKGKPTTDPDIVIGADDPGTVVRDTPTTIDPIDIITVDSLGIGSIDPDNTDDISDTNFLFKETYNIALIMPFMIDSASGVVAAHNEEHFLEERNKYKMPDATKKSLEYYEGILAALDTAKARGLNINLWVYDNQKNKTITSTILNKAEFSNMDVVIGPIYNKPSRLVADFCKNNGIIHFLPFTPSASITSDNPFHIKLNPTIDVHCWNIGHFIGNQYPDANVLVMEGFSDKDMMYSQMIRDVLNERRNSEGNPIDYQSYAIPEGVGERYRFKPDDYMEKGRQNIVVVPTFDESLIHWAIREFDQVKYRYDVFLFGMPTWPESESIRIDYLNNLNVHITSDTYIRKDYERTMKFRKFFKGMYKTEPSPAAYKGHDLFVYLSWLLSHYGTSFPLYMDKHYYKGMCHGYAISPKVAPAADPNGGTGIDYFENKYLHVLKYDKYELVKVN